MLRLLRPHYFLNADSHVHTQLAGWVFKAIVVSLVVALVSLAVLWEDQQGLPFEDVEQATAAQWAAP